MALTRHQAVGAYQRWEPPAFDAPETSAGPEGADGSSASDGADTDALAPAERAADGNPHHRSPPPAEPPIKLPTAEDIENMYEQARAEGLEAGREEGHQAGFEAGRQAGLEAGRTAGHAEGYEAGRQAGLVEGRQRIAADAAHIAELVGTLDRALDGIDQEVAEELAALAIELARQLVGRTLAERPDSVVDSVREALGQLPHAHINIHLHPDDAALVREALGDPLEQGHHRLIEDESITRGGCKLEAAGSEVDATVETRWRRVLEGLGRQEQAWAPADETAPPSGPTP